MFLCPLGSSQASRLFIWVVGGFLARVVAFDVIRRALRCRFPSKPAAVAYWWLQGLSQALSAYIFYSMGRDGCMIIEYSGYHFSGLLFSLLFCGSNELRLRSLVESYFHLNLFGWLCVYIITRNRTASEGAASAFFMQCVDITSALQANAMLEHFYTGSTSRLFGVLSLPVVASVYVRVCLPLFAFAWDSQGSWTMFGTLLFWARFVYYLPQLYVARPPVWVVRRKVATG